MNMLVLKMIVVHKDLLYWANQSLPVGIDVPRAEIIASLYVQQGLLRGKVVKDA